MLSSLFLPLPESPAGFEELKNSGSYFVEKTEYIKTVFTDSATVFCSQDQDDLARHCS